MSESMLEVLSRTANGTELKPLIDRLIADEQDNPQAVLRALSQSIQMSIEQATGGGTATTPRQQQLLLTQLAGILTMIVAISKYITTPPYTNDEVVEFTELSSSIVNTIETLMGRKPGELEPNETV